MRVAIIDPANGEIIARGESDCQRHSEYYVRVFRDNVVDQSLAMTLAFTAEVYPEEKVEAISAELKRLHKIRKAADAAYDTALYTLAHQHV